MQVWGITGLLGSGKTTAVEHIQSKGHPVINLEEVFRRLVNKETPEGREGFERIYKIFGNEVLNSLGGLDRIKLGRRLLLNPHEKKALEAAIDPLVADYVEKQRIVWKDRGEAIAFIEGSRVFESGMDKGLRGVVALQTDLDKRIKRVAKRDTMGVDEVKMMLQLQDTDIIGRLAKVLWPNNGKIADLKKHIDKFLTEKLAQP
jgi:dephospho-CoA kinase